MTAILKLVHGSNSLNLIDDDKYCPSVDFIPPATSTTPALARGTVQSRYTGSSLVNQSANDSMLDFTIRCHGTTTGEAQARARKLQSFLSHAGDKITPLQLHYRESADIEAEPLWGEYGSNKRYTIIHANASLKESYSLAGVRAQVVEVVVSLLIAPYAEGLKMRLATASGGIIEDTIGTVDGRSRGIQVLSGTINKMTNPVFGHSTWNNNWSTGADLASSENTDDDFILWGTSSAKVIRVTGGGGRIFTQAINVSNTNSHTLSAYVKREDDGAISAADLSIYYGSSKTTTYTALGDGWYRIYASFSGVASSTDSGVAILDIGHDYYIAGMQLEEKAYSTPLCYGDMLGITWASTAHASTSTRTAGSLEIPNSLFNPSSMTIRVVYKWRYANTFGDRIYLFDAGTPNTFGAFFLNTDDKIYLNDGTNQVTSSALTRSEGDIDVFHFVMGADGLQIYINGSLDGTGATYTPPTFSGNIDIGSGGAGTYYGNGTFMDFATYTTAATAAEVLADYTNIAAIIADGERVGNIPWAWTKDGDGTIDAREDSSGRNWFYCGGVPGNVPAKTTYRIDLDVDTGTINNVYVGRVTLPSGEFYYPPVTQSSQWFNEQGPTADGNANNGQRATLTANVSLDSQSSFVVSRPKLAYGDTHIFARLAGNTSYTYNIAPMAAVSTNQYIYPPDTRPLAITTAYELFYIGKIGINNNSFVDEGDKTLRYGFAGYDGAGNSLYLDYVLAINGDVLNIAGNLLTHDLIIDDWIAYEVHNTNGLLRELSTTGSSINLSPLGNIMWIVSSGTNILSQHYTIEYIDITPRYSLL